jgi:hypothetical protein
MRNLGGNLFAGPNVELAEVKRDALAHAVIDLKRNARS